MITYRVTLPASPVAIVAVRVRPVRRQKTWYLGADASTRTFGVSVRYALSDGRVQTHRGWVEAAVGSDRLLRPVAWQVDRTVVTVTLAPAARRRAQPVGCCFPDRFTLPVTADRTEVGALAAAEPHVQAMAFGQGDALLVRGVFTLRLRGSGTQAAVRIPFARALPLAGAGDLRWRVSGGVAGIQLALDSRRAIRGKGELALFYEGSPARSEVRGIASVRDMAATVAASRAEAVGDDLALVRGIVEIDVYWVDTDQRSRWTGRTVPFSGIVRLPGVQEGDRLEVDARVDRIRPVRGGCPGTALLLVSATVTHLRAMQVNLADGLYRMDKVLGQVTLSMQQSVQWAEPAWLVAGTEEEVRIVPNPMPPAPWRRLAVAVTAQSGSVGQWRLQAKLHGVPFGAAEDSAGWSQIAVRERRFGSAGNPGQVVAGIRRVGPEGIQVRAATVPAESTPRKERRQAVQVGILDALAPVRWILSVWGHGGAQGRVQILVAGPEGIRLVTGNVQGCAETACGAPMLVYARPDAPQDLVVIQEY